MASGKGIEPSAKVKQNKNAKTLYLVLIYRGKNLKISATLI